MPNQVGTSQVIRFSTFEVDLQAQELRKAGLRLKLSGQPFQVLTIPLERPGAFVTRGRSGRTPFVVQRKGVRRHVRAARS
jgi:DNA-binding response OmpR family regulator